MILIVDTNSMILREDTNSMILIVQTILKPPLTTMRQLPLAQLIPALPHSAEAQGQNS